MGLVKSMWRYNTMDPPSHCKLQRGCSPDSNLPQWVWQRAAQEERFYAAVPIVIISTWQTCIREEKPVLMVGASSARRGKRWKWSAGWLNVTSSHHGLRTDHGPSGAPAQAQPSQARASAGAAAEVRPARRRSGGQNQSGGQLHNEWLPNQIRPYCIWWLFR